MSLQQDASLQSWEVFKVLALDVGMHLTEDDKKVLQTCLSRRVHTAPFVSQLCMILRTVLRAVVNLFCGRNRVYRMSIAGRILSMGVMHHSRYRFAKTARDKIRRIYHA